MTKDFKDSWEQYCGISDLEWYELEWYERVKKALDRLSRMDNNNNKLSTYWQDVLARLEAKYGSKIS